MKETIVFAAAVAILVPTCAVAQRGGVGGGIGRGIGSSGAVGRPSTRPLNGSGRGVNGFDRRFGRGAFDRSGEYRGGGWDGLGWPYYDLGYNWNLPADGEAGYQQQQPNSIVMPIEGVHSADTPVQPEIHEYSWPSSADLSVISPNQEVRISVTPTRPGSDPSPLFSIVSKDGTVFRARAVWVQDSIVHFTTVDGGVGQLPLHGVDRESTHQANAERNLKLPLPGW